MAKSKAYKRIPTQMCNYEFNEFVLPCLTRGKRGPSSKITYFKIFNYILKLVHTGCQWAELPIDKDIFGNPEIHHSSIFRVFKRWERDGCFDKIFGHSVATLFKNKMLDLSVFHGDGTTTAAKKGGDNIGFSGHKKMKGDKVVGLCDRNCNVVAPFVSAPGNKNESPLLIKLLKPFKDIMKSIGATIKNAVFSLDGAYDCRHNRKAIFNAGMIPNINLNKRNRKKTKTGRKQIFSQEIFEERFFTIERIFAWEDKFKRLLLRFEHKSKHHYAMKILAYSMINLRHFCT